MYYTLNQHRYLIHKILIIGKIGTNEFSFRVLIYYILGI